MCRRPFLPRFFNVNPDALHVQAHYHSHERKSILKKIQKRRRPSKNIFLTSSVRPLPSLFCRPGGGFYQLQSPSSSSAPQDPRQHTQQPIVTGEAYCALFDYFSLLIFHNQELLWYVLSFCLYHCPRLQRRPATSPSTVHASAPACLPAIGGWR